MHGSQRKSPFLSEPLLSYGVLGGFVIIGVLLFWQYQDMPIVRNSLVYARITYYLADLGGDFQASLHAENKPLGFAYLALPLVKLYGATVGLKIVSLVSTALWAVSCFWVFRHFAHRWSVPESARPVFLLFLFLNPLVVYQFISGYPDMLYALAFLWSVYFLDRLLSEDVRWSDVIAFPITLLFGVWVKHHGLIVFPIILVFLFFRRHLLVGFFRSQQRYRYLSALVLVLASAAFLLYEASSESQLFNFGYNRSNFTKGGSRLAIIATNTEYLLLYLLLSFNLILLFTQFRTIGKRPEWLWLIALNVVVLLYFYGTRYNLRYYLALAPFLLMFMMGGWASASARVRHVSVALFMAINLLLTLVYSSMSVHAWASKYVAIPVVDNLRLTSEQQDMKNDIERINRLAESNRNIRYLIFMSAYYDDASYTIWSRERLIDPRIDIIYKHPEDPSFRWWVKGKGPLLLYSYRVPFRKVFKKMPVLQELSDQLFLMEP